MNLFDRTAWWLLPTAALVSPAFAVDYFSVEQVQRQLFPQASAFVDRSLTLTDEQRDAIADRARVRQREAQVRAWRAEQDGKPLGWVVIDEVIGKHEFITYAVAISPEGSVLGVEVMSYRETHGGQIRDAEWRAKLAGKTLADPLKLGKDVPNISGATLSCRNVVDGVRRLLVLYDLVLRGA